MGEVCYGRDLRDVPIEEVWAAGIDARTRCHIPYHGQSVIRR